MLLLQAPDGPAAVVQTVNRFTDFLLGYVGALAAVGALAMALIEAGKKLWDSRTKFQTKRWVEWIQRTPIPDVHIGEHAPDRTAALAELLQLCTGISFEEGRDAAAELLSADGQIPRMHAFRRDPAHAVFALELPRMMGSIQEAADTALSAPRNFPNLYFLMTSGADREDVMTWFEQGATTIADVAALAPTDQQRQAVKEYADRYARLRQIIKRRLDGFQLYTGDQWSSMNQLIANVLGVVLLFGVLVWLRRSGQVLQTSWPATIVLSLLGGVLSPIAKDIVSALKRVKDG